jgi:hypothetical protein
VLYHVNIHFPHSITETGFDLTMLAKPQCITIENDVVIMTKTLINVAQVIKDVIIRYLILIPFSRTAIVGRYVTRCLQRDYKTLK